MYYIKMALGYVLMFLATIIGISMLICLYPLIGLAYLALWLLDEIDMDDENDQWAWNAICHPIATLKEFWR